MSSPGYPFTEALAERVRANLAAHARAALPPDGRRLAAVAVTLVRNADDEACFLLTRRAASLRRHSGQWALPGGRRDDAEGSTDAALRELAEELGLVRPADAVLGVLDDYATRSGFVITPIVVWGGDAAALTPDPNEVAAVHLVPLAVLDDARVPQLKRIPESDRPVISIPMAGSNVHAPTAAIVYQLREVALHGRPTRVAHFEQPVFAWR
jgi:8-oxo-dGTP pyrophosphatase MutT (NUDIX family)